MRFSFFQHFCLLGLLMGLLGFQTGVFAEYNDATGASDRMVLRAGIQKQFQPDPGIVGLDMLIYKHRHPVVQKVFPGTPAYLKGIRPGDVIVEIDGYSTIGKNDAQIDEMISDIPGDSVTFNIQRGFMVASVTLKVQSLSYVSHRLRERYASVLNMDTFQN
ncbi:MAG: PDZ domain-containing protein [Vampirovibrionales bacterium]|nr:PDZ domain-containing protein [Vampirovibrionales bacterium]